MQGSEGAEGGRKRIRKAGIAAAVALGIAMSVGVGVSGAVANGTSDVTCIGTPLAYNYAHGVSNSTNAKTSQAGAFGATGCGNSGVRGEYRPVANGGISYTAWVYSSGTATSPSTGYPNLGGQHTVTNPGGSYAGSFPFTT